MANANDLKNTARDWRVTSYGDVAALVGLGGKVSHIKFLSPSLKRSLHTILLEAGVGAELKIDVSFLQKIDCLLSNGFKAKESATAESNYKNLLCLRPFSAWEIIGSKTAAAEASLNSVFGIKVSAITAFSNGVPIFDISAEVSNTLGIGIGASFTAGVFVGFGGAASSPFTMERYKMEKARKATDMLPKPAGGYIM